MWKKFKLPVLALGAAMAITSPVTAKAEQHHGRDSRFERDRDEHERHFRVRSHVYVDPYVYRNYYLRPRYVDPYPYGRGYYDAWGYWHPYRW